MTPKLVGYKITSHSNFIKNKKDNKWDKRQKNLLNKSKKDESHDSRLRNSLNEFRDANLRAEKQIEELEKLLDEQHKVLLDDEYKDKSLSKYSIDTGKKHVVNIHNSYDNLHKS